MSPSHVTIFYRCIFPLPMSLIWSSSGTLNIRSSMSQALSTSHRRFRSFAKALALNAKPFSHAKPPFPADRSTESPSTYCQDTSRCRAFRFSALPSTCNHRTNQRRTGFGWKYQGTGAGIELHERQGGLCENFLYRFLGAEIWFGFYSL